MSGGWLSLPTAPAQNAGSETFPVGDAKTWSVTIPQDLTGYTAEWRLGIPDTGSLLNLLPVAYSPPQVLVFKASGANLALNPATSGGWALTWATTYADTVGIKPGVYWQQAVVIDPQGNPTTVDQCQVTLTQSLRALQSSAASPLPLSPVVTDSFAIWQGDDTPPKVWSFGTPGNLVNLTGSTFVLTITGLSTPGGTATVRSDVPGTSLVVDTTLQTVTWNYSVTDSAAVPTSGAPYQLHRLINGTTQLWVHGTVVGLD